MGHASFLPLPLYPSTLYPPVSSWDDLRAMRLDLGSAIMCAHSPCSTYPLPSLTQPWERHGPHFLIPNSYSCCCCYLQCVYSKVCGKQGGGGW